MTHRPDGMVKHNAPLTAAARDGSVSRVRSALAAGADIHVLNDAPLYQAARHGHAEVVRVLLSAGASIHSDALCWAAFNGHIKVTRILLAAGVSPHIKNEMALRWAASNGHTKIIRCLLAAGANVRADPAVLCGAASNGHIDVIRMLATAGADIHVDDERLLCLAACHGHIAVVRLLLSLAANPVAAWATSKRHQRRAMAVVFDVCADAMTADQRIVLANQSRLLIGLRTANRTRRRRERLQRAGSAPPDSTADRDEGS